MDDRYDLRLYVAGQTPKSLAAIANITWLCGRYLPGRHSVEVIALLDEPHHAVIDHIFAMPTLVRRLPKPLKRIVGDLSKTERVVLGLDIAARSAS